MQPPRAQPGEQVRVELMDFATDADRLSARVMHGSDVRELELAADRTVKGRYVGSFQPRTTGDYRVLYEPRGAAAAEAVLRVFDPSLELRYPGIHRGELAMLAEATGGRLIELHALASVVEHLRGEPTLTPVHRESSIWDNALTLGILVLLYCLDIALRRLKGLT